MRLKTLIYRPEESKIQLSKGMIVESNHTLDLMVMVIDIRESYFRGVTLTKTTMYNIGETHDFHINSFIPVKVGTEILIRIQE